MLFKKKRVVQSTSREDGVRDEESFWESFVQTERFFTNWCKSSPNPELNIEIDLLISIVANNSKNNIRILDIGSGPVSILSRCTNSQKIFLQSVDPLADFYKSILPSNINEFDVNIPESVPAEDLSEKFDDDFFDIVHIRNALDHTVDPLRCLNEMYKITKESGYMVIHGFENEAVWENWIGMHQWNLYLDNESLIVSNKDGIVGNTLEIFQNKVCVLLSSSTKLPNGKTWITYILEKLPN